MIGFAPDAQTLEAEEESELDRINRQNEGWKEELVRRIGTSTGRKRLDRGAEKKESFSLLVVLGGVG